MSNNIVYGYRKTDDTIATEMSDDYFLQTPEQLIQSKAGVCWDQVELEREWFRNHNILCFIIYLEQKDEHMNPSHTFAIFCQNERYYWFENSWGIYRGIHQYPSLQKAIIDVRTKFKTLRCPIIIRNLIDLPKFGCNMHEYIKYANAQSKVLINPLD